MLVVPVRSAFRIVRDSEEVGAQLPILTMRAPTWNLELETWNGC